MLGGGRLVAAAGFGAAELEGLLAADRDIVEETFFFASAIVLVFPTSKKGKIEVNSIME